MSYITEIIDCTIAGWNGSRAVRAAFDSPAAYAEYLQHPDDISTQRLKKWSAYFAGPADARTESDIRAREKNLTRAVRGDQAIQKGQARYFANTGMTRTTLKPGENKTDPNQSTEDHARTIWQASPAIRAEFQDNFDSYLAYRRFQAGFRRKV